MNSVTIGLIMSVVFFSVFVSQVFALQKEVRKLKSIVSHLTKEMKLLKDKNGK